MKLPIDQYCKSILHLDLRPVGNDELLGRCPSPKHQDKHASFYLNRNSGLGKCHSCGFRTNMRILTEVVLGTDSEYRINTGQDENPDTYLKEKIKGVLSEQKGIDDGRELVVRSDDLVRGFHSQPLIRNDNPALKSKPYLTEEVIREYDLRHWVDPGTYYNRIAIPIKSETNEIINIQFRKMTDNQTIKYLVPGSGTFDHKLDQVIFRNHLVKETNPYLLVTESVLDSIFLGTKRYPSVSVFTNHITDRQIQSIISLSSTCILFFDGDEAGRSGAFRCKRLINNYMNCFVFFVWDKDPDEVRDLNRLDNLIGEI